MSPWLAFTTNTAWVVLNFIQANAPDFVHGAPVFICMNYSLHVLVWIVNIDSACLTICGVEINKYLAIPLGQCRLVKFFRCPVSCLTLFFRPFQLEEGPYAAHFKTLNLFAYGTYKEYLENKSDYLELTPVQCKKLQHLTIASLAMQEKCIPYSVLLKELDIKNVRDLEDLIIEAIYAGNMSSGSNSLLGI